MANSDTKHNETKSGKKEGGKGRSEIFEEKHKTMITIRKLASA